MNGDYRIDFKREDFLQQRAIFDSFVVLIRILNVDDDAIVIK